MSLGSWQSCAASLTQGYQPHTFNECPCRYAEAAKAGDLEFLQSKAPH